MELKINWMCSNETRGLFAGGSTLVIYDDIDYVTIPSEGNAIDFGEFNEARYTQASSSSTRGIWRRW